MAVPTVRASALDASIVFAYVIIFGALWRTVSANLSDHPAGQAMAFVY